MNMETLLANIFAFFRAIVGPILLTVVLFSALVMIYWLVLYIIDTGIR